MTIVTDRGLTVRPLGNACGAEITGADLTRDLTPAQVATIQQAWDEHLVLLFRGQNISQDDQLRFAANFGELGARKKAPEQLRDLVEGKLQLDPRVLLVSNMKENGVPLGAFGDGDMWFHIDSGYSERPYKYTFIYGLKLPSTGGNTLFGNMYKAYDAVPERLKKVLTGKRALHFIISALVAAIEAELAK